VRTLGVDPGTAITGYGIVDQWAHGQTVVVTFGCLETPSGSTLPQRLHMIHAELDALIARFRPDVVAVEQLFFSRNVQTAFSVGQARGVVLLAAAQHGLDVAEYTPPQVKLAIVGYGAATKEQMQRMVQRLLSLPVIPTPDDAADALAVAICHAQSEGMRAAVRRATRDGSAPPVGTSIEASRSLAVDRTE